VPKLSLSTNFDTSTRYFANYLNQYVKRYPNPNNLKELDMCNRVNLIEIARSEEEMSKIINTLNNNSPLLPVIIVEQKGDITLQSKSKLESKLLNPIVLAEIDNPTNTITLRGKATNYKGSFKLHIIARSLISAREIAFYVGELLQDISTIKYPVFVKDIEANTIYSKIDNFGSFVMTNNEISFNSEPLEETNIFRLVSDIEFKDTMSLYSNFVGDDIGTAQYFTVKQSIGLPRLYRDELNGLVVMEGDNNFPMELATEYDLQEFKELWNIPSESNLMFYRSLNSVSFFYNIEEFDIHTKIKSVGVNNPSIMGRVNIYKVENDLSITPIFCNITNSTMTKCINP